MAQTRILVFAGSLRKESYNKKLAKIAAQAARDAGAEVTYFDLADYPLPVFDEDLEKADGMPENGARIKKMMFESDGFLLACPEYNSSITAVLKNTIDWASRKQPGEQSLQAFKGKVVGLLSASPGQLGGLRGLVHVRSILSNIGVLVLPSQLAIPDAGNQFDAEGQLKDTSLRDKVADIARQAVLTAGKLKG